MNLWRVVVAALLACGLGAYIYLIERPRINSESEQDLLLRFDPADVAALRLRYPDEPAIRLDRDGSGWRITEPFAAEADDATVDRLLQQIHETTAERRIPAAEAQGLSTYGLAADGERARIAITLRDGRVLPNIIVGDSTPVGFQAFARLEGREEIIVTPLILHTGVRKSLFELRDKRLFAIDQGTIATLRIESRAGPIVLERTDGRWWITHPLRDRADANQVQTLLAALSSLEALAFYDETDRRPTVDIADPVLDLRIVFADGSEKGLRVGSKATDSPEGYFAERLPDGQEAKVPEWITARFGVEVDALRDKRLFDCDAENIAQMRFNRNDGRGFVLSESTDGAWRLEPPANRVVKPTLAARRRNGLATVTGTTIVAENVMTPDGLAAYGLDDPAIDVEVTSRDGSPCGRAIGGALGTDTESPTYYVKRAGDGIVMSLPEYLYSRLNALPEEFLSDAHATSDE